MKVIQIARNGFWKKFLTRTVDDNLIYLRFIKTTINSSQNLHAAFWHISSIPSKLQA